MLHHKMCYFGSKVGALMLTVALFKSATALQTTPINNAAPLNEPVPVDCRSQEAAAAVVSLQGDHQLSFDDAVKKLWALKFVPASPLLAEELENRGLPKPIFSPFARGTLYPAYSALARIGDGGLPALVEALAFKPRSSVFRQNALLLLYSRDTHGQHPLQIVSQSANEYASQARQLRRLTAELPNLPDLPPEAQKPYVEPVDTQGRITRLARIYQLEGILTDAQLNESEASRGNAKIVLAMNELTQLHAVEALPLIVDKLDAQKSPPQEDDKRLPPVMVADPQGLLSASIAEATPSMIRRFGPDAVPTLIQAVAMSRRPLRFQYTALELITELAGGPLNAKALMNKMADENEAKAKRLREYVASLLPSKPVTRPTDEQSKAPAAP